MIKFVMIGDALVKIAYLICVTVAAICFEKPLLLFFYILVLMMGHNYYSEDKKENKVKGQNDET